MNVGIQDAMNLGWKLASVMHGTATELLLDTYELERRPIGEMLVRNTLAQLAIFSNFDAPTLALRQTLETILRVPEVNRQLADEISGFGITYPKPLFAPSPGWEHRERVSGCRLSDINLTLKDGSCSSPFQPS